MSDSALVSSGPSGCMLPSSGRVTPTVSVTSVTAGPLTSTVISSSSKDSWILTPSCGSDMATWIFSASLMTLTLSSSVGNWMVSSSSLLVI